MLASAVPFMLHRLKLCFRPPVLMYAPVFIHFQFVHKQTCGFRWKVEISLKFVCRWKPHGNRREHPGPGSVYQLRAHCPDQVHRTGTILRIPHTHIPSATELVDVCYSRSRAFRFLCGKRANHFSQSKRSLLRRWAPVASDKRPRGSLMSWSGNRSVLIMNCSATVSVTLIEKCNNEKANENKFVICEVQGRGSVSLLRFVNVDLSIT